MADAPASSLPTPIRSPSYPNMPLREAVEKVAKIEALYRSAPADRTNAAKLIGYSTLSGPANKALAALASYGLVERAGKGEMRVTERARAILHAANETEKRTNLLAAASEPELFNDIRTRFEGVAMPPEEGVVTYLNRRAFNPSAIRPAARAFLETMAYVQQLGPANSHEDESKDADDVVAPPSSKTFGGAKLGDFVQWESRGQLQLEKPARVRWISDDGEWLAVDGSKTGIPMAEVVVEAGGANVSTISPPLVPEERLSIAPGETEWMRNKLGSETTVRLLVTGEMRPREIGRLIKLLEAQKLVLEDED